MVGGLDLVVLPGMAFTTSCKRLGHGKGYYDTYLAKHKQWCRDQGLDKSVSLVGVALLEQLVDNIPYEPHDRLLDAVIVPNQVYRA